MASDQTVREWARVYGYSVGERGRLRADIIADYNRLHPYDLHETNKGETVTLATETQTCDACGTQAEWRFASSADAICERCLADAVPADDYPAPEPVAPIAIPAAAVTVETARESTEATITALIRDIASTAVTAGVDEDAVRKIARDEAETAILAAVESFTTPTVYAISVAGRETVEIDEHVHARFADLVKIVGAGLHAYLVGGPGTGKTTLCSQVARALSLPFGMIPCDPTMPASKLFGFVDAGGTYQGTVFRKCYEDGGVFLFDELDNAHPGIIASINGAIANGHCAFPDGMVARHSDFRCIAAANTFGTGATRAFVGRNQLDAATLDRFVTVVVDIDEALEEALTLASIPDNQALGREWLAKVRGWRNNVGTLQVIISPRAAIEGARLLAIGFDMAETAEMKVWKGLDKGTRDKIERGY